MFNCPTSETPITGEVFITTCGETLTGPSMTVNFTDTRPNVDPNTNYDLLIDIGDGNGLVDQGASVQYPATSINSITPIPTDGRVILKQIHYGLPGTVLEIVECACTAFTQEIDPNHSTFAQIEANGLSSNCYPDLDHYEAEFLYQNPDVCYWELDIPNQCVIPVEPAQKTGAIALPAPNGVDDSATIQAFINSGGRYTGNGQTYRIRNLLINRSDLWLCDMNIVPTTTTGRFITVTGPDVRFYNVDIDAQDQASAYEGIYVRETADRFHFVNGSVGNFWHRRGGTGTDNFSVYGIRIDGASDYHIACNEMSNFINDTGVSGANGHSSSSVSASVDAFRVNGGNTNEITNGYFVNNTGRNIQSNGQFEDAEFVRIQSHLNNNTFNGSYPRIWANRYEDGGKAFVKHQTSGASVLSNDFHWTTDQGDPKVGGALRRMNYMIRAPWPTTLTNLIARNNRLTTTATLWDGIMRWSNDGTTEDSHFDCNQITINTDNQRSDSGYVISVRYNAPAGGGAVGTTGMPVNSTINDNVVLGPGRPRYHYEFSPNIPSNPGPNSLTAGNTFATVWQISQYA